jgi:hypothetical protein
MLEVDERFWKHEWEWRNRLKAIVADLRPIPEEVADAVAAFLGAGSRTSGST